MAVGIASCLLPSASCAVALIALLRIAFKNEPQTIMKKASRKESSKIKHDSDLKKEIGRRFKRFRQTIRKSQKQLADELQLYQSTITNIEVGKTFPATAYLRHFYDKYQLNADWLINGNGDMLHSDLRALKTAFHLLFGLDKQYFHQYLELIHLMKVPVIREVIFGKLVEMKKIAKDEIEEFRRTEGSSSVGS